MAEVKATAAPASAKPAQTAPAPLPAATKAAPERPVEKPPVRKKAGGWRLEMMGTYGDFHGRWEEFLIFGSNKNGEKMYISEI